MTQIKKSILCSVAPAAVVAMLGAPAWAGVFEDAPVLGISGDGIVFADIEEGVEEPGIQAITTTPNADFPNTDNPSGIDNCLMASNPANDCLSERGSGKRIKTWLTGPGGMDLSFGTQASSGITEYFFYGKTSNKTGARITGLTLEFGTGTGDDFVLMDPSDPGARSPVRRGLQQQIQPA